MSEYKLLGCLPNPPDRRDFRLKTPMFKKPPVFSDLKSIVLPVEDQNPLNSCVGNGGSTQGEVMWVKMGRKHEQLSRLMLYYLALELGGMLGKDEGCYPRDMAKAWSKFGCCRESIWPYDPKKVFTKPSEEAYEDALNWRVKSYYWPNSQNDIKWALGNGYPVGIGTRVFPSYYNAPKGIIPMPQPTENNQGGHWTVLCGHSDAIRYYDFVNSWTKKWGNGGFGMYPYEYIERHSFDALVLEFGLEGNAPVPLPNSLYQRFLNWLKSHF